MTTKQVILTSGTSWTVPADWNSANNTIECIGAGGLGSSSASGGGGAYAKISNYSPGGGTVSYHLGASGSSHSTSDTWFGSTTTLLASGSTGAVGGLSSACVGTTTYSGGNGGTSLGGGGAAGPNGAGNSASGTTGGSGDAGHGGAGGASGSGGSAGTEWGSAGSGGGAGWGSSAGGGNYGGGGSGGGSPSGYGGGAGVIVITYTPPASPIAGSASITFGGSGTLTNARSGQISGSASLTIGGNGHLTAATRTGPLAGAAGITFGGSGTLGNLKPISGSASVTFTASAKLAAGGPLHGAATLTLGASATTRNANAGAHFYSMFAAVYTARQALLNAIDTASKADADAANAQLAQIASDNVLSPGEKPAVIRDYNRIIAEQAGIDAQAKQNGISSATYDSAITTLTNYLATLTTPTLWSDKSGNTTIVGSTFLANFEAVYSARQTLLNSMDSALVIANPNFLNGLVGWTNNGSGWSAQTGATQNPYITSYAQFSGGSTNAQLFNNTGYPCQPGDVFACSAQITGVSGTGVANAGVAFFQSNGTLAQAYWGNPLTGSASGTSRVVASAPANAVSANAAIAVGSYSGSGVYKFSGVTLDHLPTSVDDVPDGTVHAKILASQLTNGQHNLEIAGSGHQLGDQRNLQPVTWAGVRSVLSTSPISFSISGTTVSFSVAAVTVNAGGVNISYNASGGSVTQTAGTTVAYYLYYRDPTSAGGSQSLYITTSVQALAAHPDIVMLGSASVTVASGGGGTGGTGGGGGGYCVCADMWVDADTQAKDAQPGHLFDCCDLPTRATETFKRALQSVDYHDEQCVRLTAEGGAQLDCGHTTPFDTIDGRVLRAPDMQGEWVLTDDGLQRVVAVESIGVRRVCYFHLGGISYAAGRDPAHRIYSHNATQKP